MALGLLEAMSYGNCCIASNIPENTEVAEDHALYFEKGNERDLQKRLEEVPVSYTHLGKGTYGISLSEKPFDCNEIRRIFSEICRGFFFLYS